MKKAQLHIGSIIQEKVKELGWTDTAFANKIDTSRQNVSSIYSRPSIDSNMLFNISQATGFNFFDCYMQTSEQNSFASPKVENAKVLIQIELDAKEVVSLNLKERLLTILNK